MRTEDELRQALSQAAQQAAAPATDARAAVSRRVRRQRAVRYGAVAGIAAAIVAFALVSLTRPDHRASVRVVGPGPSPTAVAGPQPDTSSSPTTSQSGTVPAGFSAVSVTFVSSSDGFVLGSAPCATPPCTVILRTSDTGKTWHRIGAPPVEVARDADQGTVHRIRFATTKDGWLFGPDLWSTHDGGEHWAQMTTSGASVLELAAAAGRVHVVELGSIGGDHYAFRILSAPIASDELTASPTTIEKGAAPVATAQLVLQGRAGWLLINERTVSDGARLTSGGWMPWKAPCTDTYGPATLLAWTPNNLAAVCDEGVWGGNMPPGTGLYLSDDGGSTFTRAKRSVPGGVPAASPEPQTVVLNGATADGKGELWATFDRGATWSVVYGSGVSELGFTTPTQGIGLVTDADRSVTRFVLSTDGGHHWRSIPFE